MTSDGVSSQTFSVIREVSMPRWFNYWLLHPLLSNYDDDGSTDLFSMPIDFKGVGRFEAAAVGVGGAITMIRLATLDSDGDLTSPQIRGGRGRLELSGRARREQQRFTLKRPLVRPSATFSRKGGKGLPTFDLMRNPRDQFFPSSRGPRSRSRNCKPRSGRRPGSRAGSRSARRASTPSPRSRKTGSSSMSIPSPRKRRRSAGRSRMDF